MKKHEITKTSWEAVKAILVLIAVIVVLLGMIRLCNYLIVDDSNSYTRLTLHEFYQCDENQETIFLGTSHCFRAYDPVLYEELTGETAFNLGSSSQNIDTSYYLLKEALKYNDVKKVYLDMYHVFLFFHPGNRELVEANIISDYMRPSWNRLDFIMHCSSAEHYTNSVMPFRRNWQLLGDLEYIRENLQKKNMDSYRNYAPVVHEDERYVTKGFVDSWATLREEDYEWIPKSEQVDLSGDTSFAMSYIHKIVRLCKEENIELILLSAPSYEKYLETMDSYEAIHEFIQEIADRYQLEYLDFNMVPGEELHLTAADFMDVDHLNGSGAQKVTQYLALDVR